MIIAYGSLSNVTYVPCTYELKKLFTAKITMANQSVHANTEHHKDMPVT